MTVDVGLREPPQVSGGEGEHGHLDELRSDPIALMARVRAECGDVGPVPAGRPRRRAADRGRGQRDVLPGPRGGARPGRGLPVHDPDLRRGRGLRRAARASAGDAPQPGAARQVHAGPRRHHRRRGGRHGRGLGDDGHDRPPRLVRRAHHLHVVGLSHRSKVPPRARPPLRRALPRPRAGHRRHRLRRPLCPHRELPPARRRPASGSWPWSGHHGPPGAADRPPPTTTATFSTC